MSCLDYCSSLHGGHTSVLGSYALFPHSSQRDLFKIRSCHMSAQNSQILPILYRVKLKCLPSRPYVTHPFTASLALSPTTLPSSSFCSTALAFLLFLTLGQTYSCLRNLTLFVPSACNPTIFSKISIWLLLLLSSGLYSNTPFYDHLIKNGTLFSSSP